MKNHLDFIADRLRLMGASTPTIEQWADRFFIVGKERQRFVMAASPPPDIDQALDEVAERTARTFAEATAR